MLSLLVFILAVFIILALLGGFAFHFAANLLWLIVVIIIILVVISLFTSRGTYL